MKKFDNNMGDTIQKTIAFFLPSLNIGGIERVFITYANYLVCKNYNLYFILCKKEGSLLTLLNQDVKIYELGGARLRNSFFKLRKCMEELQPDIIISGGDFPNLMLVISSLRLKKTPKIIISQHNYYNIETKRLGWWAYGTCFLMRKFYPKADKIIAVSDGIYEFLVQTINIPLGKIIKLPNPIDVEDIRMKSLKLLDIILPDKYILFVGRLSYVKNLFFLLEAFEKGNLGDNYLLIVGDGEMRVALAKRAKGMQKANRIIFLGAIENPLPILKHAQLLVLPSFSEAYPTILLEALCLHVPVLSTPTKGAEEILSNVGGTYISSDCSNVQEFAELMEKGVRGKVNSQQVNSRISSNLIESIGFRIQNEIIENKK